MKTVLINPPSNCVNDDRVEPSLGLLYIAANMRENGYTNVSIYDLSGTRSESIKNIQNLMNSLSLMRVECRSVNIK